MLFLVITKSVLFLDKLPNKMTVRNNIENSTAKIFELKARPNEIALAIRYLIFRWSDLKAYSNNKNDNMPKRM